MRAWLTSSGRRVRPTKGQRISVLGALGAQQARTTDRLARTLAEGGGPVRRLFARQAARDAAGLRRTIFRQEREIRSLRGGARRTWENRLASFLRDRTRAVARLQDTLEAEGVDASARVVLRELERGERATRLMLQRLGQVDPAGEPDAGAQPDSGGEPPEPGPVPPRLAPGPEPGTLLSDRFDRSLGPNDLITNHFAVLHHTDAGAIRSPTWELTSGTLFHQAGTGWTGTPTVCNPDRYSQGCTGSVIFRMRSQQAGFDNVAVSARFRHNGFTESSERPALSGDGVHIWARYDTQYRLYAATFVHRGGNLGIAKKCPGGSTNGGTYYTLAGMREASLSSGSWHDVTVSTRTVQSGAAVELRLLIDGVERLVATDTGVGCAPILGPGRIGFRADNSDFNIDDVVVAPLS